MADQDVMNAVAGYAKVVEGKKALEAAGSNFSNTKGDVRNAIDKLHPKRLDLVVKDVLVETPSTKTLRLVRNDGSNLPPFQAGQYVNLFVNIGGILTARPYAISSSPTQRSFYDLTVKRAQGGFVSGHLIDSVHAGDALQTSGPMGSFHYNPLHHGSELVFLAGGSGSAPARSLLLEMLEKRPSHNFHLIYVNSHADDVIFAEEFRALGSHFKNFTLTEIITRPQPGYEGLTGRLTTSRLRDLLGGVKDQMFFICGPTPFNESCAASLRELGVQARRIRIEANGAPKCPETSLDWPQGIDPQQEVTVRVMGRGEFRAKTSEPLLNSLERNGYFVENACRSGECSLCRVKVVSGTVFNPPEAHLRKSERSFGWVYSCVAFPVQDIDIDF